MSFSQDIKTEIANSKVSPNLELVKAEVLGYILSNVDDLDSNMRFVNENKQVVLRYIYIFKNLLNFVVVEDDNLKKNNKKKIQYVLDLVNIEEYDNNIKILKDFRDKMISREQKISFLRGVFLASGYVLNPDGDYHLEIVLNNEQTMQIIKQCMSDIDIVCNTVFRKGKFVIYIKDSDNIINFLIMIGVNIGVLHFEETRIIKEMNNTVNRAINCETGNLNKVMHAAEEQLEDIMYLKNNNAFDKLSDKDQDIANTRLKYPEYSLSEIADILGISKSGANNRFKKIKKIVEDMRKNNG